MVKRFTFKSYAWSLGTTSFRMADFHKKVEEQLLLLRAFRQNEDNKENWRGNSRIQINYYDYLYSNNFISGKIKDDAKKAKTARQKTSGLVDIGLIDDDRNLTPAGNELLKIVEKQDFSSDNKFQISKDSFMYLKQIIKTSCTVEVGCVRPFLVAGKLLSTCEWYLTDDEFTFLLPLCVNEKTTNDIISSIVKLRRHAIDVDDIIINTVLTSYDYPKAKSYFLSSKKEDKDIMLIGMNRDGMKHDKCYVDLYKFLTEVYVNKNYSQIECLYASTKKLKGKVGTLWRKILFENPRKFSSTSKDLIANKFSGVASQYEFDVCFFNYLHLIKIKATLLDYKDLNRRYLSITDAFLFTDGKFSFSPIFECFFAGSPGRAFDEAYQVSPLLNENIQLEEINENLLFKDANIVAAFNSKYNNNLVSVADVYAFVENARYGRFRHLIDTKFTNEVILSMLPKFENRKFDNELINMVGGDADVPTIFEYIVGIAWYRLSNYKGKILDYMKLSLDANLLPRTHAGGGKSDIVYKYEDSEEYPSHTLLIECSLMEGTNARRGEMEPVSRHLANYMIDQDMNTYCTFISNNLHSSVISDFRMRLHSPWYRTDTEGVDGMKIIPLHTAELGTLLKKNIRYSQLYNLFMKACEIEVNVPPQWYVTCIRDKISSM